MKKIGILTINDINNYGNRLQNYAVQEVLKKENINVETINNQKGIVGISVILRRMKCFIRRISNRAVDKRYLNFWEFNKRINGSEIYIDEKHIPCNLKNKYDYFITGSDQVWNPTFGRMSDIDFLTFAPAEKRISYSASFGIDEIPENLKEYYKQKLSQINKISVREDRAKELIENLTGRNDIEVLIDPTMMLTAEEWDKVSKEPKELKENRYILNYFLGELSEDRKSEINKLAADNNCKVINILDKNDDLYVSGPSEFLYLEKNAFLICTDSFHSSVFAILFDRPFIVFDREQNGVEDMSSRIDTLLDKFKLQDRRYTGKITEENLKHDYTEAYKILEKEREKSLNFLKRALDIK